MPLNDEVKEESFMDMDLMDVNINPCNANGLEGLINSNEGPGNNTMGFDNLVDPRGPIIKNQDEVGLVKLVVFMDVLINDQDEVRSVNPVESRDLLINNQDEV